MAQRRENEQYKRIKLLGEGSFGKVYLVQGSNDGSFYVIKQFSLNEMDEKQTQNTLVEVQVLKTLQHPYIIRFNEVYKTKKGRLCIVMEHAEGKDLKFLKRLNNLRRRPCKSDRSSTRAIFHGGSNS